MSAQPTGRPALQQRMHFFREVMLTITAGVGLCCLIALIAAIGFGITPLVFRSGSMEPAIPTGALAFARDTAAAEIAVDDVVSVVNQQGIRITHRVESVDSSAVDAVAMTLRGDANGTPDTETYVVTSVQRVLFHVDGLGYLAAWFNTVAAKILCGMAAIALLWIAVFPTGRRRTSGDTEDSGSVTTDAGAGAGAFLVLGVTTVVVLGAVGLRGTDAAYSDSAVARTGAFTSRADFAPRINDRVTLTSYVTCENGGSTPRRTPTLKWRHIGPPYQYRVILRDSAGTVWRTVDVSPAATVAAGTTMSATLNAFGFQSSSTTTTYDAEIHTRLPGGTVSSGWRGHRVYTDATPGLRENMHCAVLSPSEIDGSGAYVPPPASITCVTNTTGKTATISWPHLAGHTYRATVRDPTSSNVAYVASINTPTGTAAGQTISSTISYSNLTTGVLTGTTARVEVRARASNGTQSTGFVSFNLSATSANGIACTATGPTAARVTPSAAPSSNTTPPADPSTPDTSTAPTPSVDATTTATPAPTVELPDPPVEQPLSPATDSPSGNYSAQVMQADSGPVVVIRDTADVEEFRMPASADAVVEWVANSNDLKITDSSGEWLVSRGSGTWVRSAFTQPVPETPATADVPDRPATTSPPVTDVAPTEG